MSKRAGYSTSYGIAYVVLFVFLICYQGLL
uniref:Uncharacterized protein n=1 Tax=Arundo donax TaxID=35708 RepID=A0A0A9EL90_ARUDO